MTLKEAITELGSAVVYIGPDGTQKLCGDRCSMHVESGRYKDTCTIHSPEIHVPDMASCGWYKKGPAPKGSHAMPMKPFVDVKVSGLIYGKVQCSRCIRANHDISTCNALTIILEEYYYVEGEFPIDPQGCCNWQKSEGQDPPRRKSEAERRNAYR